MNNSILDWLLFFKVRNDTVTKYNCVDDRHPETVPYS